MAISAAVIYRSFLSNAFLHTAPRGVDGLSTSLAASSRSIDIYSFGCIIPVLLDYVCASQLGGAHGRALCFLLRRACKCLNTFRLNFCGLFLYHAITVDDRVLLTEKSHLLLGAVPRSRTYFLIVPLITRRIKASATRVALLRFPLSRGGTHSSPFFSMIYVLLIPATRLLLRPLFISAHQTRPLF